MIFVNWVKEFIQYPTCSVPSTEAYQVCSQKKSSRRVSGEENLTGASRRVPGEKKSSRRESARADKKNQAEEEEITIITELFNGKF